ncbi:hypothetical protein B0H17DRAFT_1211759 [Mycena rosella]|uniref:Peptidase M48 domain-containing protein n=1 Tax=Mycena rosella TaxID=1033263 RepID=A0AAD7CUD1_MYCRO|nr:hypothetical protein B0H17DRAFT_1211759 [Mycena rosella]
MAFLGHGRRATPEKEWLVLIINDKQFRAFAAPGLVCACAGVLLVARDENGRRLAAIIGHEFAHVMMRHTAEHLSQAVILLPSMFQDLHTFKTARGPNLNDISAHPPTPESIAYLKTLLPESYIIFNSNPEFLQSKEMRSRRVLGRATMHIDTGMAPE